MSFSWTFASQVILRVAMLSLLCSQNLFSASSPPILKNKQRELEAWLRKGKALCYPKLLITRQNTLHHPRLGRQRAKPHDLNAWSQQNSCGHNPGVCPHWWKVQGNRWQQRWYKQHLPHWKEPQKGSAFSFFTETLPWMLNYLYLPSPPSIFWWKGPYSNHRTLQQSQWQRTDLLKQNVEIDFSPYLIPYLPSSSSLLYRGVSCPTLNSEIFRLHWCLAINWISWLLYFLHWKIVSSLLPWKFSHLSQAAAFIAHLNILVFLSCTCQEAQELRETRTWALSLLKNTAHDHHLAQTRFNGKFGQDSSKRCQLIVGIQGIKLWNKIPCYQRQLTNPRNL